jgi:hypothetical protein
MPIPVESDWSASTNGGEPGSWGGVGQAVDKTVLSQDNSYTLSGTGPDEQHEAGSE